jgi:hypothetical protein
MFPSSKASDFCAAISLLKLLRMNYGFPPMIRPDSKHRMNQKAELPEASVDLKTLAGHALTLVGAQE